MLIFGVILLLAGIVSIISAILPLVKDIKEKRKKASTKSMTRVGLGFILIILAFIIFPSADKNGTAQADSDAPVEERIYMIAENAFGEVNQIVYNDLDEFVRIIVVGSENLSTGMTKSSWYMKQLDVLEELDQMEGIKQVDFHIIGTLIDQYGNESDDTVMTSSFSPETRERINFENVLTDDLPEIADEYWNHRAFD